MEIHRCKICSKCFPCGRSLGGHMRSHMRFYSSETDKEKLEKSSYGLRENPKKTCKLSDFAGGDPASSPKKARQCKVCAREFPSWKALFGHMRCHSDKKISRRSFETEEDQEEEEEEEEEEVSWNHWSKLTSADSSITEQQEVAISLMMLSRDVSGCWSIAADSSDKQSEVMEEDELIKRSDELGEFDLEDYSGEESGKQKIPTLNEYGKKRARIDEKESNLNASEANLGIKDVKLESRYQCIACNRSFHSYQALGGHRASHKRIKGRCFPNPNADFDGKIEVFIDRLTAVETEESHSGSSKKSKIHECSICGKIFPSGQALGGHKRSHVMSNADAGGHDDNAAVAAAAAAAAAAAEAVVVPELLDLNLPAPVDEESSNVSPWWIGESVEHQQNMINFISN